MTLNQHFNKLLRDNRNDEQTAIEEMAKYVLNNYCLRTGNKRYWFTEIEFYYYTPDHRDPFSKRNPIKPQDTKFPEVDSDKLFFHYSGVDISFDSDESDKMKRQYGGILIRGIKSPDDEESVNGPLKVLCHLLNTAQRLGESLFTLTANKSPYTAEILSTTRYDLSNHGNDGEKLKYIDKLYRFYVKGTKGIKHNKTIKK